MHERGLLGIETINSLNEGHCIQEMYKNICIFGQGFVGLPLALSFAFRGCNAVGVDVDETLVSQINAGLTQHTEKFHGLSIKEILKIQLETNRYIATSRAAEAIQKCNNIIVTVGVPIKEGKYIRDHLEIACKTIGRNMNKDSLIIIRSTVIPGTTEDFVLPILEEESGMKAGRDFYLAYASERIAEGVAFEEFENMPTLVGAIDEESLKRASKLLGIVCKADIVASSCIKAVETSKVFENVQRDINIAMSQEFARFTEALDIDIFEVIKLANTHKRVKLLTPGAGVGGYCIPNAYYYLLPKAEELDVDLEILRLARTKNSKMPLFVVHKVEELLNKVGKNLKGSKIAILGLAMKDYSNDDRISPPVEICSILTDKGATVRAYDPVVLSQYSFKVKTQQEAIANADAVIILTKQKEIIYDSCEHMMKVMAEKAVCIDCKAVINRSEAEKCGMVYWRI
jgi:UDP-N-acetyl-D-mannosaminuronic acid dehydrogenase